MRVGVGWCTFFSRPWRVQLLYRRLRYAYRAPALFLGAVVAHGGSAGFVRIDDRLTAAELDGTAAALADSVQLLYVASHGENEDGVYKAALHSSDWTPTHAGIGNAGPVVAVFDTCDLVDLRAPDWWVPWQDARVGLALRLVLGFASEATVSQSSSLRGAAFGQNLADGLPIAQAWLLAVNGTRHPGTDVAIAIALGDNDADAHQILRTATITNLPPPRSGGQVTLAYEVSP